MFMRIIRYDFCSRRELSTPAMFAKLCSKFLLFKEQTGDWLTEENNLSSSFCILARLLCGTRHQSVSNFFENSSLSHSWETISDAKKKKKKIHAFIQSEQQRQQGFLRLIIHTLFSINQREPDRLSSSWRTWLSIAEGHNRVQNSEKERTCEASPASRSPGDEPSFLQELLKSSTCQSVRHAGILCFSPSLYSLNYTPGSVS